MRDILVEYGVDCQGLVPTVVEENAASMEVAQQGVFGVLLFTVLSVGTIQVLLGEASEI